jgi:2',3'-cyclic-nucleotide 2'-phosphodiesterase (5'-nucleotidase family)
MDAVDPLIYTIWDAIRAIAGPYMPIQFITGHSHRRHYEYLNQDPWATTMEAGRYMDTIGFVSLTLPRTKTS